MIRKYLFITFLILIIGNTSFSQELTKFKKKSYFTEAYRLIDLGNYAEATKYLIPLFKSDKTNSNTAYLLGLCYFKKNRYPMAVKLFKIAAQHVSKEYKSHRFNETRAPINALNYLAKSYHRNYQFENAKKYYTRYMNIADTSQRRFIEQDIASTEYAQKAIADSTQITITNLGPDINSKYNDYAPAISADESTLIFTSRRKGNIGERTDGGDYYEDLYISHKVNGEWTPAKNMGVPINTPQHEASISLSPDGKTLFIYKDDDGEGNIYESFLVDSQWTKPKKLGSDINSPYDETHAGITADGSRLYFVSNRPGGLGGKDIYYCTLLPNGTWSKAQNIGAPINTPFDEDGITIHPDGTTLYFSSKGHQTLGGYDLFYSNMDDEGHWKEPKNMGYPINTPDEEQFFVITPNNKRGYFSSDRKGTIGNRDIFLMDFLSLPERNATVVKGQITGPNGIEKGLSLKVTTLDGTLVGQYNSTSKGNYTLILRQDRSYLLTIEKDGKEQTQKITIPPRTSFFLTERFYKLSPLMTIK